jgi:hypothetical protein
LARICAGAGLTAILQAISAAERTSVMTLIGDNLTLQTKEHFISARSGFLFARGSPGRRSFRPQSDWCPVVRYENCVLYKLLINKYLYSYNSVHLETNY